MKTLKLDDLITISELKGLGLINLNSIVKFRGVKCSDNKF